MKSVAEDAGLERSTLLLNMAGNKLTVSAVAIVTALAATTPAFATIDNTVTATGSSPGNTDDVVANASENVDVEDADPQIVVTKTATLLNGAPLADPSTANAAAGDIITYEYTFENTGNVTLTGISLADVHEGNGTLTQNDDETLTDNGTLGDSTDAVAANGVWTSLAPGDLVTFTSTYTVVQADLNDNGGGDNDLDNTVTFSASAAAGTIDPTDLTDTEEVDLEDQNASLAVLKTATLLNGAPLADPDTANAAVGDIITYTYQVTNDGNVPITNISLADSVTAGSGAAPTPGSESLLTDNGTLGDSTDAAVDGTWDTLGIGDVITFTGTYTVTQSDVDTLQ
ncbi:MAG: hypothetical protein AAGA53_04115 [Pseudomonadota bacterium]